MNSNYQNLPSHIQRRIDFLLQESVNNSPRDQAITYCMRVLSNYASIGMDASSYKVKITNTLISRNAELLLRESKSLKEWTEACINEHEFPLKELWEWLCSEPSKLTSDQIWEKFMQSRMVTVTKNEDRALTSTGLKSKSLDSGRYMKSGIEIVNLTCSPKELFNIYNQSEMHKSQIL